MAEYTGSRYRSGPQVLKDGIPLSPEASQGIWNHSPTGFEWGYGGSGPAQLALALLFDATGNRLDSVAFHQQFKWGFVCKWGATWKITSEEIEAWVEQQRKENNL